MRKYNWMKVAGLVAITGFFATGIIGTIIKHSHSVRYVIVDNSNNYVDNYDHIGYQPVLEEEPEELVPSYDYGFIKPVTGYSVTEIVPKGFDIELLARCVEAEAGTQGYVGKCLVIDTILNRKDSEYFPNTTDEVIMEEGQFAVVTNGSIYTVTPVQETYEAIWDELEHRTNPDIVFFRTQHYHEFGTPLFQYGEHYFSGM